MTAQEIYMLFTNKGKTQITEELAIGAIEFALTNRRPGAYQVPKYMFDIEEIINRTNEAFAANVWSFNKSPANVNARQCAMMIMREHTMLSFREIGSYFPNKDGYQKDHTTVMYSIDRYNELMAGNKIFFDLYSTIVYRLGGEPREVNTIEHPIILEEEPEPKKVKRAAKPMKEPPPEVVDNSPADKLCKVCNTVKQKRCFGKDNNAPDGLFYWCKSCKSVHNKKYRESKKLVSDAYGF